MYDYHLYKPFRNKVRKMHQRQVVIEYLNKLHEISKLRLDKWNGFTPWGLLLAIKWTLVEYDESSSQYGQPKPDHLNSLLNKIKDIEGESSILRSKEEFKAQKFIRQVAFQQFWLQQRLSNEFLGMQVRLFSRTCKGFDFPKKFNELTSISIDEFFTCAFLLWAHFSNKDKNLSVRKSNLEGIKESFVNDTLFPLIEKWTLTFDEASAFAIEEFEKYSIAFQAYEQSPFKKYPFIKDGEYNACYCPSLLQAKLENFIYDELKEHYSNDFTQSFGFALEDYIRENLEYSGLSFIGESQIKRKYGDGKTPDFLVDHDGLKLCIESKAIELQALARMNPTTAIMASHLKDSISKAVHQILALRHRMGLQEDEELYGLIVTYKQLYLGLGNNAWEEFIISTIKVKLDQEQIKYDDFDPNNLVFCSIGELDRLIRIAKEDSAQLKDLFVRVKETAKHPDSARFLFGMFLDEYIKPDTPIITESKVEADRIFERAKSVFKVQE